MLFRVTRTIHELPPGSGIYQCTVTAIADGAGSLARAYAPESCAVGSRAIADVVARRMQAALAATVLGDGHQVHIEHDEYAS